MNKENKLTNSNFLLNQTEDGQPRIEVRLENETAWMTQAMMAELYQTTPQNITLHLKAVYSEGELDEAATCKDYLQVQGEGAIGKSYHMRIPGVIINN